MGGDTHVGDGDEQDDECKEPEGTCAECFGRRQSSYLCLGLLGKRRFPAQGKQPPICRFGTNDEDGRRDGKDADDEAEGQIGGLPAVIHDDPVRQRIKDESADARGGKDDSHGQPPLVDKPVRDHHGDRDDMRSGAPDPHKHRDDIELGERPALRKKGEACGHHRGADRHNDTDVVALQELAHDRGHNHHGECGNRKVKRKAAPGEPHGFGDGLDEDAQGVHDDADTDKVE